jgi:hypothetical protein
MRTTTRVLALALAAPLSGAALVAAAVPASAGGGITDPVDGAVFTTGAPVRIHADISGTTRVDLSITAPGGSPVVVKSGQGTLTNSASTLDYSLDASCYSNCPSGLVALNGTWTIRLAGGASDSSSFVLRVPPAAPTGLSAQADGYRAVILSWTKGQEPDLTGWTVYGDGGSLQDVGTDACSGSSCSTTVTYAADGTGQHTYSLVAHRAMGPGSTDTVDSPQSSQASATLSAPAAPPSGSSTGGSSSTGGTTGGSTGGGSTGGSTTGGSTSGGSTGSSGGTVYGSTGSTSPATGGSTASTGAPTSSGAIGSSSKVPVSVAQRRTFALTFKAFAPKLGIPKLPPLPAAQPAVAPLPDGTYGKTLGYKDVVSRQKVSTPKAAARRVTGAVGSALDSSQFLRSLAGALVLLLAAAHLRRWLGSHTPE